MAIRNQIMEMAQGDPKFAQAVDAMEQAVINMPVTPEDLDEVIELLEVVVQDPSKYAEMRQAAIDDGEIDEDVLPPQFDMVMSCRCWWPCMACRTAWGRRGMLVVA